MRTNGHTRAGDQLPQPDGAAVVRRRSRARVDETHRVERGRRRQVRPHRLPPQQVSKQSTTRVCVRVRVTSTGERLVFSMSYDISSLKKIVSPLSSSFFCFLCRFCRRRLTVNVATNEHSHTFPRTRRERLDATWMKNAHVGSVSESFKIPVREDAPSTIPGGSPSDVLFLREATLRGGPPPTLQKE